MNFFHLLAQATAPAATGPATTATAAGKDIWAIILAWEHWDKAFQILIILAVGFPAVILGTNALSRIAEKNLSGHHGLLIGKFSRYFGFVILLMTLLHNLGLQLTAVLGAAGVGAVAVGFAAQTSLSNIISGFFLLGEKLFSVGDFIEVGGTKGTVMSIDLMSVKIRTIDNLYIRFPNETLIKTNLTNLSRFPIRRVDLVVGVSYRHDLKRVLEVVREVADANPHCLDEPEPFLVVQNFGSSSVDLTIGLWTEKSKIALVRNSFLCDLKERFEREGIEIPFPQVVVQPAVGAAPMAVQVVRDAALN